MTKLQTVWIDNINASNCEELFDALSYMPLLSSVLLSSSDEKETLSFQKLKPISTRLHRLIVRGGWAHETFNCPIFMDPSFPTETFAGVEEQNQSDDVPSRARGEEQNQSDVMSCCHMPKWLPCRSGLGRRCWMGM